MLLHLRGLCGCRAAASVSAALNASGDLFLWGGAPLGEEGAERLRPFFAPSKVKSRLLRAESREMKSEAEKWRETTRETKRETKSTAQYMGCCSPSLRTGQFGRGRKR